MTSKPTAEKRAFVPYAAAVSVHALNVRAGAGAEHKITEILFEGEEIEVLEEQEGWGRTQSGWLMVKYCKKLTNKKKDV